MYTFLKGPQPLLDADGNPVSDDLPDFEPDDGQGIVDPPSPVPAEVVSGMESFTMTKLYGRHLEMREFNMARTSESDAPVLFAPKDGGGTTFWGYVFGQIVSPAQFVSLLSVLEMATEQDEVVIYIHSPGGCVCTGALVASAIKACKTPVTTVAMGQCASAGSLMWSAGAVCKVTKASQFMYHMSSHRDQGNTVTILERASAQSRYVRECLLVDALAKGHITQEELEVLSDTETNLWINPMDMASRIQSTEEKGV